MNRDDVLPLLRSSKGYLGFRALLQAQDEVEVFHGLFWIAVEEPYQPRFVPILDAGRLLFDLNPTCQISCREAVQALLSPGWDISLEEVPWYLYKQFGMVSLDETIDQLKAEPLSKMQRVELDTVKYWVDIIHDTGLDVIEERWRESLAHD